MGDKDIRVTDIVIDIRDNCGSFDFRNFRSDIIVLQMQNVSQKTRITFDDGIYFLIYFICAHMWFFYFSNHLLIIFTSILYNKLVI
jgi:hypothetical protein